MTLHDFDPPPLNVFRPVGDTDSERAFCVILNALRRRFPEGTPDPVPLRDAIAKIISPLARRGAFNFLLSNGEQLFAHCATDLCYVVRQAPFSVAHLVDEDITMDFSELTTPNDRVAVIATQPLTDNECWITLAPGELLMFEDGAPQMR